MSQDRSTSSAAVARPAPVRLATTIPDAGASGIIDVADLRAEDLPWLLAGQGPPPEAPPRSRPTWAWTGIAAALAASALLVSLASAFEPAPTIVIHEPTSLAPQLSMQERAAERVQATIGRAPRALARGASPAPAPVPATSLDDEPSPPEPGPAVAVAPPRTRAPKPGPKTTKTTKTTKPPKIDAPSIPVACVLDPRRCDASGHVQTPGPAARPQKLSASQIKQALASTKADARRCGPEHGADAGTRVQVKLSIDGGSGTVVSASAQGEHAQTSLGRCVALALSQTHFPPFQTPRMGTLYSVHL